MKTHLCMDIRGALARLDSGELDGCMTNAETDAVLSRSEIREWLWDELSKGRRVVPTVAACDNFDYQKGCQGHPDDWQPAPKTPPLLALGEMNIVMLRLGPRLFEFHSFEDWVSRARHLYSRGGYTSQNTIAIDQLGRICDCGADFRRAQESDTYPINVYDRNITVT